MLQELLETDVALFRKRLNSGVVISILTPRAYIYHAFLSSADLSVNYHQSNPYVVGTH